MRYGWILFARGDELQNQSVAKYKDETVEERARAQEEVPCTCDSPIPRLILEPVVIPVA